MLRKLAMGSIRLIARDGFGGVRGRTDAVRTVKLTSKAIGVGRRELGDGTLMYGGKTACVSRLTPSPTSASRTSRPQAKSST
jgi:hypothetical protein